MLLKLDKIILVNASLVSSGMRVAIFGMKVKLKLSVNTIRTEMVRGEHSGTSQCDRRNAKCTMKTLRISSILLF